MSEWREGQAAQYDHYVAELDKALAELDNLEAILDTLAEPGLLTETRSYAGGIRALRTTLVSAARDLRRHHDVDVLPMGYTTRRVR